MDSDKGLSVEIVKLEKLPDDRVPAPYKGGFAYTIKIINKSGVTVQLLGRKWMIKQADGSVETVEGDGVVGAQPVIAHNGEHVYTSYCLLHGTHGAMWGFYFGRDLEDNPVMWRIPKFEMRMEARSGFGPEDGLDEAP
ncbi:MAG: ApaG domain-containing protein [Nitrospinae bacterium]|nr:ApaG domain-containing protein [Nitrospinota bacterium]